MLAALAAVSMNAQNNMYVGGSLGFATTTYDGDTQGTAFSILPEFGVQLSDKWGVGVTVGYNWMKNNGTPDLTSDSFEFAPYVRFTPVKLGSVNVFVDGVVGFTTGNVEAAVGSVVVDNKFTNWGIGIQPGIAYNINEKFSLVAKFGNLLAFTSNKPKDGKATNTFSVLDLNGNDLSFGFYYNF